MKKTLIPPIFLAVLLFLSACTILPPAAQFDLSLVNQLAAADVFSEPLEPLDADILWALYALEDFGLNREQLVRANGQASTGATCEAVCVLHFSDPSAAKTALNALQAHIDAQIQSNREYRPAEVPKLEKAWLSQRGSSVLLLVASNYDKAITWIN